MTARVKAVLRPLLPAKLHSRWQKFRFDREQAQARGRSLEDVFNDIYERGVWSPNPEDGRYHSGPGSMPAATAGYETFVAGYINAHPEISSIVDIGCGDFQVSDRILEKLERPVSYTGCDVASKVVEDNKARHSKPGRISFEHINVVTDEVPGGDIVTIREVFQHLSNENIAKALANIARSFKTAIITEAVPIAPAAPNLDIVSGYRTRDGLNSGVFLEEPPFSLNVVETFEQPVSPTEVLRTIVVRL